MNALDIECWTGSGAGTAAGVLVGGKCRML